MLVRFTTMVLVEILVIVVSTPNVVVVLLVLILLMLALRLVLGLATLILLRLVGLLGRCGCTSVGPLGRRLSGSLRILTLSRILILLDQVLEVQLLLIIIIFVGVVGQDIIIIDVIINAIIVLVVVFLVVFLIIFIGLRLNGDFLGLFSRLLRGSCWLGRSSLLLGLLNWLLRGSSRLSRSGKCSESTSSFSGCSSSLTLGEFLL